MQIPASCQFISAFVSIDNVPRVTEQPQKKLILITKANPILIQEIIIVSQVWVVEKHHIEDINILCNLEPV